LAAVPEAPVGGVDRELLVDDGDRVEDRGIVGLLDPSRTSSRKLGSTTVRSSAALGPLSPIE
jgi:multidrug efflux pump subunit AcrA (membrane-fusion protein)